MGEFDPVELFGYALRYGAVEPIEHRLGIKYVPPAIPEGMDLDDEFQFCQEHIREWVRNIWHRLYLPEYERQYA